MIELPYRINMMGKMGEFFMKKIRKTFHFFDEKQNPVVVTFYENDELTIEMLSKDKTYFLNCGNIVNFQVTESYYFFSLMFVGRKITYKHKGKEKKVSSFNIRLQKDKNIDYQHIFENNSSLKTPHSIHMKKYNEWKEKVNNHSSKKGTIIISNCPIIATWKVYVDGFAYTSTKPGERTLSFELPFGRYTISYASSGSDSGFGEDRLVIPAQMSNGVDVELSDYTPQIKLKAKRGLFSLKLRLC